jgi:Zn-dependent peptidase ImmA (M78 family)
MLNLPMTFDLFSQTWTIRAAQPGEIESDLGQCRPDQLEILINPYQSSESQMHTLWHEITHAFEQKLQLALTEQQVDLLALCLLHFFRTNTEFTELLNPDSNQITGEFYA